MKIGNIDLGYRPAFLAPMEDVTDIGFRLLCRKLGAAMVYSEFVSCDALVRMVNKSLKNLKCATKSGPWPYKSMVKTRWQWPMQHV